MMSLQAHFRCATSDDNTLKLLEMPYFGHDLSMIILLPSSDPRWGNDDQITLADVEEKLTSENLRTWLAELDRASDRKISVSLPRFTTTQSFNLSDQLKSMGMASAFSQETADFSGMDGTRLLYISDVLHKAFVEVNEEGTEAAAASAVLVMARSMPERFVVDHPFIFLIRDNGSGAILFIGRIINPTK